MFVSVALQPSMDPRALYVEHLDVINRIAESLCRRNGIRDADAEDFVSEVRLKLLQDDCAVLAKFRGTSSTTTFLTVVISNLFRDHRIKQWGKWRPSAEARRHSQAAVLLEMAVYRDGRTFEEACTAIENNGSLGVSRDELRQIMARLPRRPPRRVMEEASDEDLPADDRADARVLDEERDARVRAATDALQRAVARLDSEDRVIVRMRFFQGFTVAEVARALGIEQKPLYTRLRRILETLARDLEGQGVRSESIEWLDGQPP
jgi:RNA polymerase sigma factor (sigma-70 family)